MIAVRRTARLAAALLGATAVLGCATACGTAAPTPARAAGTASSPAPSHYVATAAAAPYTPACDGPALIAHRGETGDGADLPENTWQAELAAAAEGATYLNLDVRWTSDGVPVALHDATVNRTTSESVPNTAITRLTVQQYVALDARSYAGDTRSGRIEPNVHPDTLAEVLSRIAPTGKTIVLQMEADPYALGQSGGQSGGSGSAARAASAQQDFTDLAQVIQASGYAARVIVAGWTLADLRAFHAAAPNVALAAAVETIGARYLPTAQQILATGAHILYVDYRGLTAHEVSAWHAAGLKVWAWTPADRAKWQQLRTDGVEAIATNWSKYYLKWVPVPCSAVASE